MATPYADLTLEEILPRLAAEEKEVLRMLAARLLDGQTRYGVLDLANDRRNLENERAEEVADLLVYTAMAELQRVLRRRP